ncbi:MAG: hypothetical protein LBR65_01750, partial [Culturomica sp.]|nr:hypothetical protein [Culturomica sp.]
NLFHSIYYRFQDIRKLLADNRILYHFQTDLHPISTRSPPHLHPIYTRSTPDLHPIYTRSTPDLHPVYTRSPKHPPLTKCF